MGFCALRETTQGKVYQKKAYRIKTVYGIAFRHALNGPIVMEIDIGNYNGLPGSEIFIRTFDDIRVEEVTVSIVTANGVLVEQGNAYLPEEKIDDWTYGLPI